MSINDHQNLAFLQLQPQVGILDPPQHLFQRLLVGFVRFPSNKDVIYEDNNTFYPFQQFLHLPLENPRCRGHTEG